VAAVGRIALTLDGAVVLAGLTAMNAPFARVPMDVAKYARRACGGRCFICAMLAGEPRYRHHLLYSDAATVAFLSRYPTLPGYTIVAPRRHAESRVRDLSEAEFLAFQAVVRRVALAR
jgi:hypothetical protein